MKIWTFTSVNATTWLVWFCKYLEVIVTFRDLNRHAIDEVLHLLVPAADTYRFKSRAVEVQTTDAIFDVGPRLYHFLHHRSRRVCLDHHLPSNRPATRRRPTVNLLHRSLHLHLRLRSPAVDSFRLQWDVALYLHLQDHRLHSCRPLLRLDRGILMRIADLEVMVLRQTETVAEYHEVSKALATTRTRIDTAAHLTGIHQE